MSTKRGEAHLAQSFGISQLFEVVNGEKHVHLDVV